jgi:pantetheine-phosphate adenylyltransferase
MSKIAIYPGSFDPVTNGHVDIVRRGSALFDKVIVAIMNNPAKKVLFSIDERIEMLKVCLADIPNIQIDTGDGLTVEFARKHRAVAILRGMRAVSDFDSEFQLALMNRKLNKEVLTVFLMTGLQWIFISSSIIKEAAQLGGDIKGLVPPFVEKKLKEKYAD